MTHPIDIVAAAVHAAQCGCGHPTEHTRDITAVALNALTDDRVATNARRALLDAGYYDTDHATLDELVRVVLRSVGEA